MSEDKKKRKKYPNVATPKGVAGYMWIHKADMKYDNGHGGTYRATVTFERDDITDMLVKFEEIASELRSSDIENATGEKKGKLKNSTILAPGKVVYDEEGNDTGKYLLQFKQRKLIKFPDGTSKEVKPWVKDAKKNDTDAIPFAGSVVRVVFEPSPYYTPKDNAFGVSLRLKGTQIIELVSGGHAGSGGESDLLDEEDGYTDEGNDGAGKLDDSKASEADDAPSDDEDF